MDKSPSGNQFTPEFPRGLFLGPYFFLYIYINDLTSNIKCNIKLFADYSSLFIKVKNIVEAQNILTNDLNSITNWENQWKMEFNPDLSKQTVEIVFSTKYNKEIHPPLSFNGIPVAREEVTKHLGLYIDEK